MKLETNRVPRLLFLSNLIESKGVLVLLDALKVLKDKGYSFICDFVGGETKEIDAKRFEEEVEKRGLNELAIYRGRKYGEEKEKAFEQSDVFVFPTYYPNECFPLVLLEAMQHGLPCVTTDEGGIRDIVVSNINGFICERKDAASLATCLIQLILDRNMRIRMGEASRERLYKFYTERNFENNMEEILKKSISVEVKNPPPHYIITVSLNHRIGGNAMLKAA